MVYALNSMEDDKASGPDGFPLKILKICWDVVGKDVTVALQAFCSKDQWCKSLSATFITLIPKRKGALEIKDFFPISLVGSLYKLSEKALFIHFKFVLQKVILIS